MSATKKANTWSWEERGEIVREFRASGQTQRAFCRQWGITANTLRSWCRRLGDAAGGGGEPAANAGCAPPRLLELQVRADAPASKETGIGLVTRSGVRIEVYPDFDAATLQRLLALVGDAA
jgi:transposase-like protein